MTADNTTLKDILKQAMKANIKHDKTEMAQKIIFEKIKIIAETYVDAKIMTTFQKLYKAYQAFLAYRMKEIAHFMNQHAVDLIEVSKPFLKAFGNKLPDEV